MQSLIEDFMDRRWTLIPVLTGVGLVSSIVVLGLVWFPTGGLLYGDILFTLFGGLSLGLAWGAVLWFYGLIRSERPPRPMPPLADH